MDLRRVARGWALLDLVVTGALAIRPLAVLLIATLFGLDASLGGSARAPAFGPMHWLFVNLAGILGVLWALVRILEPTRLLVSLDAAGRCVVAGLLLHALFLETGAPRTLLAFVATELAGAAHQALALSRARG